MTIGIKISFSPPEIGSKYIADCLTSTMLEDISPSAYQFNFNIGNVWKSFPIDGDPTLVNGYGVTWFIKNTKYWGLVYTTDDENEAAYTSLMNYIQEYVKKHNLNFVNVDRLPLPEA